MSRKVTESEPQSILSATRASIAAATHLSPMDAGAVAMLVELARVADYVIANGVNEQGKFDNVTVPTYLRACDALGLTPSGRTRLEPVKKEASGGGTLSNLRALAGGKA